MDLLEDYIQKDYQLHQPKPKVIGFSGSPRRSGNSDTLLSSILEGVQKNNVPTIAVHQRNYQYDPCIGCERCRKDKICTKLKDGMTLLYPPLIESKGIVLVSPAHNYNITAWMKAFIDRLYCFYEFDNNRPRGWSSRLSNQGRKAVLAAVCEQVNKQDMGFTLDAMRIPLEALGYEVIGELPVYGIFDKGKVKEYEKILNSAKQLGAELGKSL